MVDFNSIINKPVCRNWQTRQTQNLLPSGRVGSSPTTGIFLTGNLDRFPVFAFTDKGIRLTFQDNFRLIPEFSKFDPQSDKLLNIADRLRRA